MHFSALPASSRVVISAYEVQLEHALKHILGDKRVQFFYTGLIKGTSISGRIFFCERPVGEHYTDLADYDHGEGIASYLAASLVQSVTEYPDETRFPPIPDPEAVRGWEIRKSCIRCSPVAIAWAAWVI